MKDFFVQIQRVWSKDLYGALNIDARFKPGINLLVGINGSGKTSLLSIIGWLLGMNIAVLATTRFKELGIQLLNNEKKPITLRAVQKSQEMLIYGSVDGKEYHPIHVKLTFPPSEIPDDAPFRQSLKNSYSGLAPDANETPLWNLIRRQKRPTTILLDRTVAVEDDEVQGIDVNNMARFKTGKVADPISSVEAIARNEYARYQGQLIRLNDELKAAVISSSFETGTSSRRKTPLTLEKVSDVESKLLNRMSAWTNKSTDINGVKSYFLRLKRVVSSLHETKGSVPLEVINQFFADEMTRIARLSNAFEDFDKSSNELFEPLKNYLQALNSLFSETGKELFFDDSTNSLRFHIKKEKIAESRSISLLSSGERQVLILLTYIAFPNSKADVFIIDEPELSLHLKWQHDLLGHVESLKGSNAQMIIATHSPEIVGTHTDRCVVL